jgi:hypothetical protein
LPATAPPQPYPDRKDGRRLACSSRSEGGRVPTVGDLEHRIRLHSAPELWARDVGLRRCGFTKQGEQGRCPRDGGIDDLWGNRRGGRESGPRQESGRAPSAARSRCGSIVERSRQGASSPRPSIGPSGQISRPLMHPKQGGRASGSRKRALSAASGRAALDTRRLTLASTHTRRPRPCWSVATLLRRGAEMSCRALPRPSSVGIQTSATM